MTYANPTGPALGYNPYWPPAPVHYHTGSDAEGKARAILAAWKQGLISKREARELFRSVGGFWNLPAEEATEETSSS